MAKRKRRTVVMAAGADNRVSLVGLVFRGFRAMMRAVIGAAADFIVRSAHYPILVVRGDGILRGVVPHPDTRDAAPEGELETIGEKRTTSRPV